MYCPTIAVVNQATVPLGVDLPTLLKVMQTFIERHFMPHWGRSCKLVEADSMSTVPPGAWALAFINDADVSGALGYHDLTVEGLPFAKVFVKTALENGEHPSVVFSHEIIEGITDPMCQMMAVNNTTGDIYSYEPADPTESDLFVYEGITLSNFVFPAWYESFHVAGSTRLDFLSKLATPFQLSSGGYASIIRAGQFTEVFGSQEKAAAFANEDRRNHRTEIRKQQWSKSMAVAKMIHAT